MILLAVLCFKWTLDYPETALFIGIYAAWTIAASLLNIGIWYQYAETDNKKLDIVPVLGVVAGATYLLADSKVPVSVPATWAWASIAIASKSNNNIAKLIGAGTVAWTLKKLVK